MSQQSRESNFATNAGTPAAMLMLVIVFMMVTPYLAHAQTFTVLHSFTGAGDGNGPQAGLSMDRAGNLYGTTVAGGGSMGAAAGTVFRLSHARSGWTLNTLFTFTEQSQGSQPQARVIFGPDGNLYGTTIHGGVSDCDFGCGTVFRLRPPASVCTSVLCPWTETVLHSFTALPDGSTPGAGDLTFDQMGNIYGTTTGGGLNLCLGGCGVVFKLSPSHGTWTETIAYSFTGAGDGSLPEAGVIFDNAGDLYGTAFEGGVNFSGTVYELTPSGSGWTEKTLHSFQRATDGGFPVAGLIFDPSGHLYGTTSFGGSGGGGTVFSLTPSGESWIFSALHSFVGNGTGPDGSLVMDAVGDLYGVANSGGGFGFGSVFELTPSGDGWTFTSLHDFTGGTDGKFPFGNVTLDANGNLFGTASEGGAFGEGVVWEIVP
jgi:uncharacterized repeat protein (TIGR03803 family)